MQLIIYNEGLGKGMRLGCNPEGTHLEKGYGDVRPLRPPFHALSAVS